jgi:hypothetical protein
MVLVRTDTTSTERSRGAVSGFFKTYAEPGAQLQDTMDAAVVMPTILRPELRDALRSVFAQDLPGRVQVLIGIDTPTSDISMLDTLCAERPPNFVVQVFYPGYSTSVRHAGLAKAQDGGALRSILSYLANSPYVAYLDDDNWWRPDHLRLLRQALNQTDWAYSLRWFVHPASRRAICVDKWESVGPFRGVFHMHGGWVDPNCLMLNKVVCEVVLAEWSRPLRGDLTGATADRNIFKLLRERFRGTAINQPTAFYQLNPSDVLHPIRLRLIGRAYEEAGRGFARDVD